MTFALAVSGLVSRLIHILDLVGCMREGCTDIIGEVLTDVIEVMKFQLVTLVLGLTEVSGCHGYTYPLWTAQVLGQDIVTVLNEVVEVTS